MAPLNTSKQNTNKIYGDILEKAVKESNETRTIFFNGLFVALNKNFIETSNKEFDAATFHTTIYNGRGSTDLNYITPGDLIPVEPIRYVFDRFSNDTSLQKANPFLNRVVIIAGGEHIQKIQTELTMKP
jgi:hypothetical protein